jgi:hypothetical protein
VWRTALEAGTRLPTPVVPPHEEQIEGDYGALGFHVWNWALDAPLGTWSQPIEQPGAWYLAKVVERKPGLRPVDVALKVDVAIFPWIESDTYRADYEAHLDKSKLEFVDAAWRDVVPTLWQRRLRGSP